jgi:hypothetical protein
MERVTIDFVMNHIVDYGLVFLREPMALGLKFSDTLLHQFRLLAKQDIGIRLSLECVTDGEKPVLSHEAEFVAILKGDVDFRDVHLQVQLTLSLLTYSLAISSSSLAKIRKTTKNKTARKMLRIVFISD